MTYDNTNRGTLGKNKRKEKDSHPDLSGKINIEGVDYWLSAWVKESNGERFWSLSAKRKEERTEAREGSRAPTAADVDSIPF